MFYCEKFTKKSRKNKECVVCGKNMKGESSYDIPNMETYCFLYLCPECYKKVQDEGIDTYEDLREKYYD